MKTEIPKISSASDSGLLPASYAPNASEQNFQNYLDDETKRIAIQTSPWALTDFSAWFGYPQQNNQSNDLPPNIALFADYNSEKNTANKQSIDNSSNNESKQSLNLGQSFFQSQNFDLNNKTLQQILVQSGWLMPNLAAQPLFQQAQLEGKLFASFDLQALIDQIISQAKLVKQKGQTSLMLGLKPDQLGEILLTLSSKAGLISINIAAPQESYKLLSQQIKELELMLKKAKINLEEIKLTKLEEVNKNA